MNKEPDQGEHELMRRHDIRRILIAQYLYKEYRYFQLCDAVAQSRRDKAQSLADL